MRVLFSSTRGAGHFNPLVPFARAFERAGAEVRVAGPPTLADAVAGAGFEFWEFDPPPEAELAAVWDQVRTLSPDEANEVVVGEIFGRLNTTAALPRLREACAEWRPDLVLRDPNEYASALAAELHGVPHWRVAIGIGTVEELGLSIAAGPVDAVRSAAGLPSDPGGDALRRSPFLSTFPASLDEGAPPLTYRFHDPAWDEPAAELPNWWATEEEPLVYVTFGSVAGGIPEAAPVFGLALEALAGLPVRALLTVGRELDLSGLGPVPDNVRVERWVPQQDVLAHADAVVCHGGSGSTLGAVAAGRPLVVVPLFADQPENARRVAEVGAGVAVSPDAGAIRKAIETVLADPSYTTRAGALAAELRAAPPVDEAVALFESSHT